MNTYQCVFYVCRHVCDSEGLCMGIPTAPTPDLAYCFSADQRRNGG